MKVQHILAAIQMTRAFDSNRLRRQLVQLAIATFSAFLGSIIIHLSIWTISLRSLFVPYDENDDGDLVYTGSGRKRSVVISSRFSAEARSLSWTNRPPLLSDASVSKTRICGVKSSAFWSASVVDFFLVV